MKRNFLQDVIPPNQKRSIRDIPLPRTKRESVEIRTSNESTEPPEYTPPKEEEYFYEEKPKRKFNKIILSVFVLLVIFTTIFFSRTKAEITVEPKKETASVSETYKVASKDENNDPEVLTYSKKLNIEKQSTIKAKTSGEEEVKQKASGTIKIFNEYSKNTQKLVKNTRFETKNGLIYRITSSVDVPGYKEEGGKIIPGEIETEIFADLEGDKYNMSKTDFTIPGFVEYPDMYKKIYAKSVTDITGGYVGTKKIVSEEDKNNALQTLKEDIKNQVIKEIQDSGDEFFVAFDENKINYSKLTEENSNNDVILKLSANVDVYAFNLKEFSKFFALKLIPNSPDSEVLITNLKDLKTSIISIEPTEETEGSVNLSIEGNIDFEWIIDTDGLKNSLLGKERQELKTVIEQQPSIKKAEVKLSPFWNKKFPKNPSKIKVIIKK